MPSFEILVAGPPCQSFSTSNQRTRRDENPLNNLLFVPVEITKLRRPLATVVENVHGLGIGSRRKYLHELVSRFESAGYQTQVLHVSGAMVGLPQNRTRLFVVATRFKMKPITLEYGSQPTVKDTLDDLPELDNGAAIDLMPYRHDPESTYANMLRGTP